MKVIDVHSHTAGNPVPDLLPLLLKVAPADHIMYGCDYPFTPAPICVQGLKQLTEFLDTTPELKQYKDKILWQNAERLCGGFRTQLCLHSGERELTGGLLDE